MRTYVISSYYNINIPADFPERKESAGNCSVCKNPQENHWEYLRNFLKHKNPQETILNYKIRRKNLRNTCGLFSAGNSAVNKQNFSSDKLFVFGYVH
ncbi:hypothetical protein QL285_014105 [Trifolium repens]|nr:hypothetical protein QL285_014105 [Trifolium repens]